MSGLQTNCARSLIKKDQEPNSKNQILNWNLEFGSWNLLVVFHKYLREMRQIQALFLGHQPYPPLPHCQGAKEDVDCPAFFVMADFINDHGVRYDLLPLD